jgi:hypothetical protein
MSLADIRPALRQFLLEDSTLTIAVGGERIFPVVLPQGVTAPSVVYKRISGVGDHTIQAPTGLAQVRMQIDAYAQTQSDADELSRLIKERLDGYSGPMGNVQVQGVFYDTMRDDYQDDVKLFRVSQDFMIVFEER